MLQIFLLKLCKSENADIFGGSMIEPPYLVIPPWTLCVYIPYSLEFYVHIEIYPHPLKVVNVGSEAAVTLKRFFVS